MTPCRHHTRSSLHHVRPAMPPRRLPRGLPSGRHLVLGSHQRHGLHTWYKHTHTLREIAWNRNAQHVPVSSVRSVVPKVHAAKVIDDSEQVIHSAAMLHVLHTRSMLKGYPTTHSTTPARFALCYFLLLRLLLHSRRTTVPGTTQSRSSPARSAET